MGTLLNRRRYMGGVAEPNYLMTTETNPEVLAICYSKGWCASSDYMTYEEAAAVTNIGTTFMNKKTITHFEELEYFRITALSSNNFFDCKNLVSIHIPSTCTNIHYSAFRGASKLKTIVVNSSNTVYDSRNDCNAIIRTSTNALIVGGADATIPDTVASIGEGAYYDRNIPSSITIPASCTSIGVSAFRDARITGITFVLPSLLTTVGNYAFYDQRFPNTYAFEFPEGTKTVGTSLFIAGPSTFGNGKIIFPSTIESIGANSLRVGNTGTVKTIVIKAATPPSFNNDGNYISGVSIYVPDNNVNDYKESSYWSNLASIIKGISELQS